MTHKILITGGAGFIGSHLVDAVVRDGWRVVVLDDFSSGSPDNLAQHRSKRFVEIVCGDVRDAGVVDSAAVGCDVIAHFAAKKIPRYGNRFETLETNATGMANVLAAARHHCARVLFASTSDCYGINPELPFSEQSRSVLGPSSVARWAYATSKLYGEHLCFACREEFGTPITILRFFGSYGPREHRSWWGGPQAVFIESVLDGRALDLHGGGTQTRSFSFISDTIAGTVAALNAPLSQVDGEVFNIGNSVEIRIIDLASKIQSLLGVDPSAAKRIVPYERIASRPYEDPDRRRPDLSKARAILGFEPRVDLDTGLRVTIDWHLAARAADAEHRLLRYGQGVDASSASMFSM